MHHQMTYLPSNSPLPPFSPLPAPLKVLSIFQKLQQQSSNSPKKIQIKVVSPKKQDYKSLYETKCEQLAKEMEKSRQFESEIEQLRRENKELSIQIKRMQEDKWDKCNTFRQSQNRKRSKSIKKMTPTIEVKVPNDFQGPLSSGNRNNEEFTEYINLYRQQIELYKDEIKKLNEQVSLLRQKQQEPFDPFPESFSNPKRKEYQTHSPPTATQHHQNFDIKKHLVSDFSPSQPQSIDTIKKDKTFTQEVQFELKRLKNELLYKELLLDKLKQESIKENSVLQKHLKLSVKESKKVAETTAEIMNAFKKQMIQLWRQLEQEKNKNNRLEDQLRKQPSCASEVKSKWEPSGFDSDRSNLMALLQIRRTEKIQ